MELPPPRHNARRMHLRSYFALQLNTRPSIGFRRKKRDSTPVRAAGAGVQPGQVHMRGAPDPGAPRRLVSIALMLGGSHDQLQKSTKRSCSPP